MARRRIRIVRPKLSHIDKSGAARMVDVSAKDVTDREAVAEAWLLISPPAAKAIETATLQKGDAVATARLAGITAAKRT
ncbi:MAG: cyclic pyranopterin monophosphate synthase MoaC, partial [Planctomycetes bacterium]|nr:cyclic pyranopterin monophosphate synthase MoaC [Planctomycetota bacterium]